MMTLFKKYKKEMTFILIMALMGQVVFALFSKHFTTTHFEGRIYATTATEHRNEDLHKLNEAAHYFGQTMIGWTKFPHFVGDLKAFSDLPSDASLNAHIQERQNIIFTVSASSPVSEEALGRTKEFIQGKMDEYNAISQTKFVLSNLDYEQVKMEKTYTFGAVLALFASMVVAGSLLFVRKEFLS